MLEVADKPVTFANYPIAPSVGYASKSVSPSAETASSSVYMQHCGGFRSGVSMVDQLFGVNRGTRAVLFEVDPFSDHGLISFGSESELHASKEMLEAHVEHDSGAAKLWKALQHCMSDVRWKAEAHARIAGVTA